MLRASTPARYTLFTRHISMASSSSCLSSNLSFSLDIFDMLTLPSEEMEIQLRSTTVDRSSRPVAMITTTCNHATPNEIIKENPMKTFQNCDEARASVARVGGGLAGHLPDTLFQSPLCSVMVRHRLPRRRQSAIFAGPNAGEQDLPAVLKTCADASRSYIP